MVQIVTARGQGTEYVNPLRQAEIEAHKLEERRKAQRRERERKETKENEVAIDEGDQEIAWLLNGANAQTDNVYGELWNSLKSVAGGVYDAVNSEKAFNAATQAVNATPVIAGINAARDIANRPSTPSNEVADDGVHNIPDTSGADLSADLGGSEEVQPLTAQQEADQFLTELSNHIQEKQQASQMAFSKESEKLSRKYDGLRVNPRKVSLIPNTFNPNGYSIAVGNKSHTIGNPIGFAMNRIIQGRNQENLSNFQTQLNIDQQQRQLEVAKLEAASSALSAKYKAQNEEIERMRRLHSDITKAKYKGILNPSSPLVQVGSNYGKGVNPLDKRVTF